MAKKTQISRLVSRLMTGKNLTVSEARRRLGVKNLSARVHELRVQKFEIYTNKVSVNGKRVTAYRLNTNAL